MVDLLFLQVLSMSQTASLVILAVVVLRLCLRRAPKLFSYALWSVVLVRLLCPLSIQSPVGLFSQSPPVLTQSAPVYESPIPAPDLEALSNLPSLSWRELAGDLWLLGIVVMALYAALSYLRLRQTLSESLHLEENIYLADRISTPFVLGLVRPRIYLPSSLEQKELPYILLHEKLHIRRGDHMIKVLAFAALCLHWFNPLVWLASVLAGQDMEMSCDEAVVKKLGSEVRADYSASLLHLAAGRRIAPTPLAFGEGDPKGRIHNLARWKQPMVWTLVAAAILCVIAGVCLLTDRAERPQLDVSQEEEPLSQEAIQASLVHFDKYGLLPVTCTQLLGTGGSLEETTEYFLSLTVTYALEDDQLVEVSSVYLPTTVTYTPDGPAAQQWYPRVGANFEKDVQATFPADLAELVLDHAPDSEYTQIRARLERECEATAQMILSYPRP